MAQELMHGTASNYDIPKLVAGQTLSAVALILSFAAASRPLMSSLKTSLPFLIISLLYGIMMFASSYVEEEQNFWYWASSAWLGLLWFKRWVVLLRRSSNNTNTLQFPEVSIFCYHYYITYDACSPQSDSTMEPNWTEVGWRT